MAAILFLPINCSTLTKFQLSDWSSAMPKETESIKKKLNSSKRGIAQWLPDYHEDLLFLVEYVKNSLSLIYDLCKFNKFSINPRKSDYMIKTNQNVPFDP